jgi:hypothetical protein
MDLSFLNAVGVIAFLGLKFVGYILAFVYLKRIQPAVQSGALPMACTRAVLGVIAGGALYFAWDVLFYENHRFYKFSHEGLSYYLVLTLLRVFVWVVTIHFFTRRTGLRRGKVSLYVMGGTLWSSFMDIPAAFFAFLIPGGILFC